MVLPFQSRLVFRPVPARVFQRIPGWRRSERRLWPEFPVFRACCSRFSHAWNSSCCDVGRGVNVPVHRPVLGTDGHLTSWVRDPLTALVAQLRRVGRAYCHDPAAVLRHVVGEPLNQLSPVPPPILHGVTNPARIFHRDNRVPPQVGEVSYLLCGENRKLTLLPGCGLTVEPRLLAEATFSHEIYEDWDALYLIAFDEDEW